MLILHRCITSCTNTSDCLSQRSSGLCLAYYQPKGGLGWQSTFKARPWQPTHLSFTTSEHLRRVYTPVVYIFPWSARSSCSPFVHTVSKSLLRAYSPLLNRFAKRLHTFRLHGACTYFLYIEPTHLSYEANTPFVHAYTPFAPTHPSLEPTHRKSQHTIRSRLHTLCSVRSYAPTYRSFAHAHLSDTSHLSSEPTLHTFSILPLKLHFTPYVLAHAL